VTTVALGVALAVLILTHGREIADLLRRHALLQAELVVCGGTLGGLLVSRMDVGPFMQKRLAMLDKLYESAARSRVRVESGYTHYLPCVLLVQADATADLMAYLGSTSEAAVLREAIGGVLYVGPAGIRLRMLGSSTRDQRGGRAATDGGPVDIDMGGARQVTAASIALPKGKLARVTRSRRRCAMLVRWPTGQAIMAIPSIGDTLPRLQRCLDQIRWGERT